MSVRAYQIFSNELDDRLDVFFHLPEFKKIEERLSSLEYPVKPLSELATIFGGSTPKDGSSTTFTKDKVKFLKTLNIQDYFLDLETLYYISETSHKKRLVSALQKDDVLLNIIGANLKVVGRVTIVPENFGESNLNQNIAGIRVNDAQYMHPYYLMAILGSEIAQTQIAKISRQAGQVNLNTKEVGQILIPVPPQTIQQEIVSMINNAQSEREQCQKNLEIKLEKFDSDFFSKFNIEIEDKFSLVFLIQNSDLTERIDAEYYRPSYRKLENALTTISKPLKELGNLSQTIIDPKKTPDKEYHYVEIENLDSLLGKINDYQIIRGSDAPSRARVILNEGDIIVPSLQGTFKKIALVTSEFDGCIGTTGFLIIKPTKINPLYLYAVLRSKIGQLQLERAVTGSIMPALTQQQLSKIMIPCKPEFIEGIEAQMKQFLSSLETLQNKINSIMHEVKNNVTKKILND